MEDAGLGRGGAKAPQSTPGAGLEGRVSELLRTISRALRKAERRMTAVAGDLRAIEDAQIWAARAPWFLAEAAKAPRGATVLEVPDWSTGVETKLQLPLDPAQSPREQVERIFGEARRLRRGRDQVSARLEQARAQVAALSAAAIDLAALGEIAREGAPAAPLGSLEGEVAALETRLRPFLPRGVSLPGEKTRPAERLPYRSYEVSGGLRVYVGRDAKSNDELTLHVAKPHHLWLHAKGYPGSHVVALVDRGHDLTQEQLVDCAHLAAHFSEARGETLVEVSYLPRRYLRKPRKSPPGAVVLDTREKVLTLRVDEDRLKRLLTSSTGGVSGLASAAGDPRREQA